MSKDYKNRVQRKPKAKPKSSLSVWQWMLITALVILFVVFLAYLRFAGSDKVEETPATVTKPASNPIKPKQADKPVERVDTKPKSPHFDFYQILPGKEVVVPEHEIKTRAREERMGKAKESRYLLQAGSFKTSKEAEQQRAKLALMGIESKMEKAKVGETYWYRVKLGPFEKIATVNDIQARLKKNSVDVIVTEVSNKKSPPATTH